MPETKTKQVLGGGIYECHPQLRINSDDGGGQVTDEVTTIALNNGTYTRGR